MRGLYINHFVRLRGLTPETISAPHPSRMRQIFTPPRGDHYVLRMVRGLHINHFVRLRGPQRIILDSI